MSVVDDIEEFDKFSEEIAYLMAEVITELPGKYDYKGPDYTIEALCKSRELDNNMAKIIYYMIISSMNMAYGCKEIIVKNKKYINETSIRGCHNNINEISKFVSYYLALVLIESKNAIEVRGERNAATYLCSKHGLNQLIADLVYGSFVGEILCREKADVILKQRKIVS
jgi:hypothetical protein